MTEDDLEFDSRRSMAELAGEEWDPARWEGVERLVSRPLRKLAPGELLYLIELGCGLEWAAPCALLKLDADPFLAAGRHAGDLLTAVLGCPAGYWREHPGGWLAAAALLERVLGGVAARMEDPPEGGYLPAVLGDDFMAAVLHFRAQGPAAE